MSAAGHTRWAITCAAAAFSLAVFLPFGWAVRGHFVRQGRLPLGMTLLTMASLGVYGCMLLVLFTRDEAPSVDRALGASALMALAAALFWWAIATTRASRLHLAHSGKWSDHVQSSGPYHWVRHPFYTAYMVFWIGTATLAGGWQWLPVCVLIVWYLRLARAEEQQFSGSAVAITYAAYRDRTGMVLPQLGSLLRSGRC